MLDRQFKRLLYSNEYKISKEIDRINREISKGNKSFSNISTLKRSTHSELNGCHSIDGEILVDGNPYVFSGNAIIRKGLR
jgi:hypothetical protein